MFQSNPALTLTLRVSSWISVHSHVAVTCSHLILFLNIAFPGFNTYLPVQAPWLKVDREAELPHAPLDEMWWVCPMGMCAAVRNHKLDAYTCNMGTSLKNMVSETVPGTI